MYIVYILTNYNKILGNGNYLRCLEIKKNISKNFKTKLLKIDDKINFKKEKINTANCFIIDIPNLSSSLLEKLKKFKKENIFIDYFGNAKVKNNILIYNHSIKKRTFSLSNSIIREEFFKYAKIIRQRKKLRINVVIILGSYDLKKYNQKVVNLLIKNSDVKLNIELITKNIKDKIFFEKKRYKQKIKIHFDKKNIAKIIHQSQIVISNGGTSCLEALYLKKIVIALGQNEQEKTFVRYLKSKNYIYGVNLSDITNLLRTNIDDVKAKLKFANVGNGINKITKLLKKYESYQN